MNSSNDGWKTPGILWFLGLVLGPAIWIYETFYKKGAKPVKPVSTPVVHPVASPVTGVLAFLPHLLEFVLAAIALYLVAQIVSRIYWRYQRARAFKLREIVLGPDDVATPYEVMSAIDAIHMTLLTRYAGSAYGQDYWTFEIIRDLEGMVHFVIGAHKLRIGRIEQTLRAKYTNIRFQDYNGRFEGPFRFAQNLTLSEGWQVATETQRDYTNSIVETIVQAMDACNGPVHLQYHMTPLPLGLYHHKLQQWISQNEYSMRAQQVSDPAHQGVGYAEDKSLKNSIQLMGKGVYRVEIRLGCNDFTDGQSVFGAVSEANDENKFQAKLVLAFRSLWHSWLERRMPSVFFPKLIMFSFPLATLIHLPSNRLRVSSLVRWLVRRAPVSRAIPSFDDMSGGIMMDHDSGRPVGIPEKDREGNIAMFGSQGSGKTTDLLSVFRVDCAYRDSAGRPKAVVLIDIGKDTSKRALGLVDPARKPIYFNPADPDCAWTVNPLQGSASDSVIADNVLNAMTQVFGEEAIRFRSREFLGNAVVGLRNVLGPDADFVGMYRLLSDAEFRNWVSASVTDPHQIEFWQKIFPASAAADPNYISDGLAAPRNKLDELLRNQLVRAVFSADSSRKLLDMSEIIRNRSVLIVNLDRSKLGEAGSRIIGVMLIQLLWIALQAQNDVDENERVKVSLIMDEAQDYLPDSFLNMLSEGRAYGLQNTVALRFLGELDSKQVISGLHALVQNVIVHQFQLLDEAEEFMKRFMRLYSNMVQVSAESQDSLNFGADDIMRLPKFTTICQWMVNGTIQQAFLGKTINWELFFKEEWRRANLAAQPKQMAQEAPKVLAGVPQRRQTDTPLPGPAKGSDSGSDDDDDAVDILPAPGEVDKLTGLVNNNVLERVLRRKTDKSSAVVFIDLDGLKDANDNEGHAAGDDLLKRAATALKKVVREGDVAARKGGDEYVAILPGFGEEEAINWVERVRSALTEARVRASIGFAIWGPGQDGAEALAQADAAMYREKKARKAGRGSVALSAEVEATLYRAADKIGINPEQLLAVVAELKPPEKDVAKMLVWLIDNKPGKSRAVHVFRTALQKSAAQQSTRAAKEFVMKRYKMTRPELEAVLQEEQMSDEAFVEFAREFFFVTNKGRQPSLNEFRLAWRKSRLAVVRGGTGKGA